jgi:hypothetical protein
MLGNRFACDFWAWIWRFLACSSRVVCHPLRPALLFALSMSFEKGRLGSADMIDRDDKSPHCSCGAGDGSDEHSRRLRIHREGPDAMSLN